MDIKNLLDEEIERLLTHIKTLGYGSEERKAAISELDRLYKLKIEETKNEQDYKKDCERRAQERELHEADEALKRAQLEQELKLHQADEALKRDQMAQEREFHEADDKSKRELLSDQGIERYFRYGAMALELVLPLVAYGVWYHKGLKFEETGTVTSAMTKNLIARMLPKKK